MKAVTAWWPRMVECFTTSSSSSQLWTHQGTYGSAIHGHSLVAQELLQFVSLTVEGLRAMKPITLGHPSPSTENQMTPSQVPSFYDRVVPKLPLLGKAVAKSNCSHSFIKLVDVVSKCLHSCSLEERRKELLDHVEVLFTAGVLCWSPITKDALKSWFDREGKLVHRLLMLECGVVVKESATEWLPAPLPQSTSDIILRKYLVLLLQVQVTACHHDSSSMHSTEGNLLH